MNRNKIPLEKGPLSALTATPVSTFDTANSYRAIEPAATTFIFMLFALKMEESFDNLTLLEI